jgi:hypothetical protein
MKDWNAFRLELSRDGHHYDPMPYASISAALVAARSLLKRGYTVTLINASEEATQRNAEHRRGLRSGDMAGHAGPPGDGA